MNNGMSPSRRTRDILLLCVALVAVTVAVYIQVGNHEFINFDDPLYVTSNPHVAQGITRANIIWAFTTIDACNWAPITWLSHMSDVQLYDMNPRGHHFTNVVIHSLSSVLLLVLLFRITGSVWRSSFVAALFALHPLHVESVAWIAERKDVLSAFFWFLTLLFYSEYVRTRKNVLYFCTLIFLMAGLMAKAMLVTLPIIMLLMDFWPFNRFSNREQEHADSTIFSGTVVRLITEKIPFLALSLFSAGITIFAQHKGGATASLEVIPFIDRINNALIVYVQYISKTLWPSGLAILYPESSLPSLWMGFSALCILLVVTIVIVRARQRHPFLILGWFWYLVTLVPVIGIIHVGYHSMADRYTYIPMTGFLIMVAWGVPELVKNVPYRKGVLTLLAGTAIIGSIMITLQQLGYWRDSISLYQRTLQVTTGNYIIHNNLGEALDKKGDLNGAALEYQKALRIKPDYFLAQRNLGVIYDRQGNLDAAIQELQKALRINPDDSQTHNNLGSIFESRGDLDAAIQEFRKAIKINPNESQTHSNLGITLAKKGYLDDAIQEFQKALLINPDDSSTYNYLKIALTQKGAFR